VASLGDWRHFDTKLQGASFYSFRKTLHKSGHLPLKFLPSDFCLAVFLRVKPFVERILAFLDYIRSFALEII